MAAYIKREDAIKVVNGQSAFTMSRKEVIDQISAIPTADVAQVVHGRWVNIMLCNNGERMIATCSHCKDRGDARTAMTEFGLWEVDSPHCPNCGAKMDGGKGDASD